MREAEPLIQAQGLGYGPKRGRVLARGLSFELLPGQILLIAGPNGAGKSTLLRVILQNLKPLEGMCTSRVPSNRVGYLPQLQNTHYHLPITLGDVLETAELSKSYSGPKELLSLSLLEERHWTLAWNTSSGGERKRTLLTRTLAQDPMLLVLDEPMNHLDQESRIRVKEAVARFLSGNSPSRPRAVIMVSHESALEGLESFKCVKVQLMPEASHLEKLEEIEESLEIEPDTRDSR